MALVPALLKAPAYVANSATSVITVASSTRASVKSIILNNLNTAAETVKLHVGVSGASAADSNQIIAMSIPASTTVITDIPFPLVLAATDILYAQTTTASKVVITITGTNETV